MSFWLSALSNEWATYWLIIDHIYGYNNISQRWVYCSIWCIIDALQHRTTGLFTALFPYIRMLEIYSTLHSSSDGTSEKDNENSGARSPFFCCDMCCLGSTERKVCDQYNCFLFKLLTVSSWHMFSDLKSSSYGRCGLSRQSVGVGPENSIEITAWFVFCRRVRTLWSHRRICRCRKFIRSTEGIWAMLQHWDRISTFDPQCISVWAPINTNIQLFNKWLCNTLFVLWWVFLNISLRTQF